MAAGDDARKGGALTVVGPRELLALHGAELPVGPVVALRGAERPVGPVVAPGEPAGGAAASSPDVVWRATPGDAAPGVRTIAPGGEGLWRRAVLPAADALFALPAAAAGVGAVLVAGGDAEARSGALEGLAAAGVEAFAEATPSPEDLVAAAVVVACGTPGAPLPSLAPAVLAAGRVLVAPRSEPAFGFAAGVDHLAYGDPDELARLAVAAARHPAAFALMRRSGRIAAGAHRASAVYARIAFDLDLA